MLKLQRNMGKKLLTCFFWVKICHLTTSAPDGKVLMSLSKGNRKKGSLVSHSFWYNFTVSQFLPSPPSTSVNPSPSLQFLFSVPQTHNILLSFLDYLNPLLPQLLPISHVNFAHFPATPAFFHIFWPELCGWPAGSSSTCSGFSKVLPGWSVLQCCTPQTLGQILPTFLTESRENRHFSQAVLKFILEPTDKGCGIQKSATQLHGFIQIQPPTQSPVRDHWLKHLLCFSIHFFNYTHRHWY